VDEVEDLAEIAAEPVEGVHHDRVAGASVLEYFGQAGPHRPPLAHPADKIESAQLLKGQGHTLGQIAAKTGIPKTSLHRYLTDTPAATVVA
jgi:hypothetical protein